MYLNFTLKNLIMSSTIANRPRMHHMDVLKGIAIFMVVMGHVLTMCVREIDRTTIFKFIGQIHMPVFFFISGWFTLKLADDVQGRRTWKIPALLPRAKRLVIPMLFMSTLWIFYFPHSGLQSPLDSSFHGLWFSEWKNGYWFTLVLFEIVIVYTLVAGIMGRLRNIWAQIGATIVGWCILLAIWQMIPVETNNLLMVSLVAGFFPVFMAGAIASAHREGFHRLTQNSTAVTIALVTGAFLLYFICWPWEFDSIHITINTMSLDVEIARSLFQILLAFSGIAIVRPWCEKAFAENAPLRSHIFAHTWEYLGRESLAIYLLHYFFLFPMWYWRPVLEDLGLSFVPCFLFSAFWAAIIIAVVLIFSRIISPSRPLSFLMAGRISSGKA